MRKLLAALLLIASLPAHGALVMYWDRGTFGDGILEIKRGPAVVLLEERCKLRVGAPPKGLKFQAGFFASGASVVPLCWYEVAETSFTVNHIMIVTEGGYKTRLPRSMFEIEGTSI